MRIILIFFLTFFSLNSLAISPELHLDDPSLEQRAMKLFLEVKCLVCQGQAIESSNTEFSRQMRKFIRKKISEQKTDQEIKDELVKEFGDQILLSSHESRLIWVFPAIFAFVLGFVFICKIFCKSDPS